MDRGASFGMAGQVVAWHAHTDVLSSNATLRARALDLLSGNERDRFDRYREDDDRMMFLLGRMMARTMVGRALGVPPDQWPWHEGPHGRPEVGDPSCLVRFNLAHSAGLVVCAITSAREIGVDVEDLERRAPSPLLVSRYCSPAEAADINVQDDARWTARFLAYWTLKEAYLKARGLGISLPLAEIELQLNGGPPRIAFLGSLSGTDDRWAFHLNSIRDRYLVALAAAAHDATPTFVIDAMPAEAL